MKKLKNVLFKNSNNTQKVWSFLVNRIKFVHVFWVLFYLLLFGILINNSSSYLDPDFGWHLKVGEEISYNRQVPRVNTYNYTYTGNWVDHEWLSNLALYKVYNHTSYNTVLIIFAAIIILTLIILNIFIYLKDKTSFGLIAFFQLIGLIASLPHFGVRLQEIALLLTLLLIIIISYYNKSKNWKILIAIPPIMFLWSNLHASFLIGFFVLFSWIAIKFIEQLKFVKKVEYLDLSETLNLKQIFLFLTASIIALFSTCLTPYGLSLYSFLLGYKNKAYLSLIEEWLPQSALPLNLYQLIYLAMGTIAISFYIYQYLQEKKKINLWKIFLPTVLLILSFKSKRHFPLFFIVSFELMFDVYKLFFYQIKLAYAKYLKITVIVCLVLIVFLQFSNLKLINNPATNFCINYPCQAINFLKNNPQYKNDNILNEYVWGGFLIWLMPEKKIFIDGRLPQVEFSKWTFVEEYYNLITNQKDIPNKLKEYNIKLILIKRNQKTYTPKNWEKLFFPINTSTNSKNELMEYLDKEPNWNIIYQDNVAKIYFNKQ